MARKTIFVSDFSDKAIDDPKQGVTVTLKYGDGRKGVIVADAHVDDALVKQVERSGRQQARRGRPVIRTPRVTIPAKPKDS